MSSAWAGPAPPRPQLHSLRMLPRLLGISSAQAHLVPGKLCTGSKKNACRGTAGTGASPLLPECRHSPSPALGGSISCTLLCLHQATQIRSKIRVLGCSKGNAAEVGLRGSRAAHSRAPGLVEVDVLPAVCPTPILSLQGVCHHPYGLAPQCLVLAMVGPSRAVEGLPDSTWSQKRLCYISNQPKPCTR